MYSNHQILSRTDEQFFLKKKVFNKTECFLYWRQKLGPFIGFDLGFFSGGIPGAINIFIWAKSMS